MTLSSIPSSIIGAALRTYGRVAFNGRGTYRLARMSRRLIPRQRWRAEFPTSEGLRFDLDLSTYPDCCMAFGLYELDVARLIRRSLRPDDHFVDGGANIGYFTAIAAHCVGPGGRVDAFEPEPQNRARLEANLARNGLTRRVHVHAAALSDRAGAARIHLFRGATCNHGCSSLFDPDNASAQSATVPTLRLDETLRGTTPRLIKLDVEGAEPLAVEGMGSLLNRQNAPLLIIEYNRRTARLAGFEPREWIDRLHAIQPNYALHVISGRPRRLKPDRPELAGLEEANLLARVEAGVS